ncbi:BTAD domain-containing putative transcriptional regulator [Streptomyces tirandamycinicus]|uniref:BTAD domain-containing putative transcriptional regulator n=1 Tax=Streptomyces tirandamycinicus TaxID=2174846 RepID=UPI0022713D31|nr:BTAD domain-containing putative transcriptional regulator [Streptomyces tirandamycinicus]MCY0985380.1 BTAD domain-containing putative transcriptional regulator [Streptomyces tirandamycinicus]
MEFRLLGPLEVGSTAGPVRLGGTRQRAALAYLLLHANQVVSARQLTAALWPADQVPDTARKILQNAVWRLRRSLTVPNDEPDAAQLMTRAPGYMVRVPAERVDLLRFQRLAAQGRAALSSGDAERARGALREALALWRGPALADLAEVGLEWPELIALEQKRLDVMEDCFEVELQCGEHKSVLRDLDGFVRAEPLRERAAQQLMLALYRCGRQADALGVYTRIHAALVEGLGLEPGRDIQQLQRSILAQDPQLDLPVRPRTDSVSSAAVAPAARARPEPHAGHGGGPADAYHGRTGRPSPAPAGPAPAAASGGRTTGALPAAAHAHALFTPLSAPLKAPSSAGTGTEEAQTQQLSSVLMLRFGFGTCDGMSPDDVDHVLDSVCELARQEVAGAGGMVATSIGSVLLGLFTEDRRALEDGAERAIRAALAVRDCLITLGSPPGRPAPVVQGLSVHAAVATGTALVYRWPAPAPGTGRPWTGGDLVDQCDAMLSRTPAGKVHVCDVTRRRTQHRVDYRRVATSPARWQVLAIEQTPDDEPAPYYTLPHSPR